MGFFLNVLLTLVLL